MNTYLMPVSSGDDVWIESVKANNISEAEEKFVKKLANEFDCVDFGDNINSAADALYNEDVLLGDIYDIEEF